jgi:hypothetical protein
MSWDAHMDVTQLRQKVIVGTRIRFRYGCLAALMLTTFVCNESFAAENPLLGSWKWDNAKTLHEFTLPTKGSEQLTSDAAKAKRFIESAAKKLGSNTTVTYSESDCIEIVHDNKGTVLSKSSFPYRIVEMGKDYIDG